ncbi:MAG TPA: Stp1/IreP family PP2C-type Ser/Thr phosphatase [Candidatus Binataceae bacterium]|nr:Stp1/IreP family PP2C-type Ser/Thr phosphatase [Candidatus Binataceae bacterium]
MITCPECGQQADDGAKFCDRCGQGLSPSAAHTPAASIAPLAPGTELQGYRIVELLSQSSRENRYRAGRRNGKTLEPVQLREQKIEGTSRFDGEPLEAEPARAADTENPAGPRAKTADLNLKESAHAGSKPATAPAVSDTSEIASDPSPDRVAATPVAAEHAEQESISLDHAVEPDEGQVPASDNGLQAIVLSESAEDQASTETGAAAATAAANGQAGGTVAEPVIHPPANQDLGEAFGRVLALSMTLNHAAFQRAIGGFADDGRAYLVYADDELEPLARRPGGLKMDETEAVGVAIQVCQAVSFAHRRGLRVNDLCPQSVARARDGRIKLTGLDYISNDNELQAEPVFNDGYTAPEIYRARKVDKRADVFSIGALIYSCLTGERIDAESWREEAGPIRFYPPHVVSPALEQVIRQALRFDPGARWPTVDALKAELVKLAAILTVRAAALTDVGMVREHNEDSVLSFEFRRDSLVDPAQTLLYVVADGMGGAEAGEVASAIAVGAIRNYVEDKLTGGAADVRLILQDALELANTKIVEYQAAHPEARGMGSTAVGVLMAPPEAAIAWVGDSRGYLHDGNGLRQLTKDHSLVQRLMEIGQITAEEARHHEHKNVITRSLGARPKGPAGAESLALRLKRGDRLMLCSDGLTAHVEDRQIGEILRHHSEPSAAARELVVAANTGGGTDNVSVVVIFTG